MPVVTAPPSLVTTTTRALCIWGTDDHPDTTTGAMHLLNTLRARCAIDVFVASDTTTDRSTELMTLINPKMSSFHAFTPSLTTAARDMFLLQSCLQLVKHAQLAFSIKYQTVILVKLGYGVSDTDYDCIAGLSPKMNEIIMCSSVSDHQNDGDGMDELNLLVMPEAVSSALLGFTYEQCPQISPMDLLCHMRAQFKVKHRCIGALDPDHATAASTCTLRGIWTHLERAISDGRSRCIGCLSTNTRTTDTHTTDRPRHHRHQRVIAGFWGTVPDGGMTTDTCAAVTVIKALTTDTARYLVTDKSPWSDSVLLNIMPTRYTVNSSPTDSDAVTDDRTRRHQSLITLLDMLLSDGAANAATNRKHDAQHTMVVLVNLSSSTPIVITPDTLASLDMTTVLTAPCHADGTMNFDLVVVPMTALPGMREQLRTITTGAPITEYFPAPYSVRSVHM